MILSRANLNETSRRLKLNYTHEQLFRTISIRQASRNSNYFFITATTRNPKLSADIANTLSEVFLEDYKNSSAPTSNRSAKAASAAETACRKNWTIF